MFGQMCSLSHRVVHQFETTIDHIRSVSFAVNDRKTNAEAVLINFVFHRDGSTETGQEVLEVKGSLLPNRDVLKKSGLTTITHIISMFAGRIIPAFEYSQHFGIFDLNRSKRLDANKFAMKFLIACHPEKIHQILNFADKPPVPFQAVNRIRKQSFPDRSMESYALGNLETTRFWPSRMAWRRVPTMFATLFVAC